MPIKTMPTFKTEPDRMLQIPQPGIGGLNLNDLEYEQEINQSPYMLNMMYRNGTFSKRYGQEIKKAYDKTVYAMEYFDGKLIVHSGETIYCDGVEIGSASDKRGFFVKYGQSLYYFCDETIYEYKYEDGMRIWVVLEPYVPTVFYSAKPDGSSSENGDNFNVISDCFIVAYNGDGTTKTFKAYGDTENIINWGRTPKAYEYVGDHRTERTDFTVSSANKSITFTGTAPASGGDNVEIVFYVKEETFEKEKSMILNSKYYATYGNADNSRLFLAGFGDYGKSCYFYSEPYDASYFSPFNYEYIGNSEEDIKGFGLQYNVLFIFKAKEIYSVGIYTQTFATTQEENLVGKEAFKTQLVNANVGCDAPYTIQLIDNKLTWFNSIYGVCTLVSTNIVDERNVRVISRNINKTNNFGVKGILDYAEDLNTLQSADFNNKYFLVFPMSGMCYMWDYGIQSYYNASEKESEARKLDWYLFNNFYVSQFKSVEQELLYLSSKGAFANKIIKLNDSLTDLDFDGDGIDDGIEAYYQTPYNGFDATEMLKTITNVYVQCRGDRPTSIDMTYITDEDINGEKESEPIKIPGALWRSFTYKNFNYKPYPIMNTFRRKCSIKKVQVLGIRFYNNVVNSDMSISHLSLQYRPIKYIK